VEYGRPDANVIAAAQLAQRESRRLRLELYRALLNVRPVLPNNWARLTTTVTNQTSTQDQPRRGWVSLAP
jgi:hypothetical protein